jgi:LysM repeat protein
MLCTDGLTDQLTEIEIAEVIGDSDKAPEHKCKNLIELANEKGGIDCISVQIIEFSRVIELQKPKREINFKPILYVVLGIIALIALGFGSFKGYEAFKNRPEKEQMVDEPNATDTQAKKKTKKPTPVAKKESTSEKAEQKAPKAELPKESKKAVAEKNTSSNGSVSSTEKLYYSHQIKSGENLYRIAIRYNVTQKLLIEINGKKATGLVSGTKLKIPVKAIHNVANGESFSGISNKYNVKIKLICAASNIDEGSALKEGQILVIPLSK